jgi:hypothetical protein
MDSLRSSYVFYYGVASQGDSDLFISMDLCAICIRQSKCALQWVLRFADTVMTEHEPAPASAVWGRATPPANHSLGPVDPSWLAKLSAHLGINPARTVASLLLSIWPGTGTVPVCCRESCAFLMQVSVMIAFIVSMELSP